MQANQKSLREMDLYGSILHVGLFGILGLGQTRHNHWDNATGPQRHTKRAEIRCKQSRKICHVHLPHQGEDNVNFLHQ